MRKEQITACCVTVPRLNNLRRLVPKVLPYVDRFVLIVGREDSEVNDYLATLGHKISKIYYPWRDNFADSYNQYIKQVAGGWMLMLDDDEVPSDELLSSMNEHVNASNQGQNFCCVEFCANPIYLADGREHDNGPTNYYRQLLVRWTSNLHYRGGPQTGMHQYLVGHQNGRLVRSPQVYYHIKSVSDEHRNAARNFWIASIWHHGTTEGEPCEAWRELKAVVKEEYPEVESFMDLDDVFISGSISQKLKDWMVSTYNTHRSNPDMNEGRAVTSYYFKHLHPEELPEGFEL